MRSRLRRAHFLRAPRKRTLRFEEDREQWEPKPYAYLADDASPEEKQKQKKRERRLLIFFGAVIAIGIAGMYIQYEEDKKNGDGSLCCAESPYLRDPPPTVGDPNSNH